MAGGYLGKISAVISANTGDYVRGLNESAKQTQAFASTVQSTLRRASQDAAKSFQGIYTPFQQFERALRAVSRERLSFKGFEGAIRTVTDLKNRLDETLSNREIDLVVKSSGLRSIEQVKDALRSITSRDIDLAVDAGGINGLRRLRAELESSGKESTVLVNTEVSVKRLDSLIEKFAVLDDRQINAVINVLNEDGLDKAIVKARQLRDVADSIEGPLASAVTRFGQLSGEVQAAFIPALGRAQTATEQLRATIESGGNVGRRQFQGLQKDVDRLAQSISRLSEAQGIVGRIGTGSGLREANPRQFDVLNRAAAATQSAAGFTGAQVAGFGIGGQQAVVEREARSLQRLLAVRERIAADRGDTRGIDRAIDLSTASLDRQVTAYERLIFAIKEYNAQRRRGVDFVAGQGDPAGTFGPPRPFTTLPRGYFTRPRPFFSRDGDPDGPFGPPVPPDLERRRALELERARLASRFLRVDQRESQLISNRGESSPLAGARDLRANLIARIRGEIESTRRSIATLAEPLRSSVSPEVDRIVTKFRQLASQGISPASDQVARLRKELAGVNATIQSRASIADDFSSSLGGAGAAGLNLGVDRKQLQATGAQIEFLQGRLSKLSAEARGPAIAALQQWREVATFAFRSGTAETDRGRAALAGWSQEAVRAAAAALGVNPKRLGAELKRVGDVARGSFGNVGLAVQQAAFAIDDFFSVTGGLDQRIRAAGNNLSQLGFILGSTKGLIAGISVSIGAQLVAALIKWADGGKTAEDRTKALTDALARQKSLVDELRDSFASLGESIGGRAFSGASADAREFEKRIEEIAKKQRDLRRDRILSLDQGVVEARAGVNVAQRNLERQTTVGGSVLAQRQLEDARRRLDQAERAATARQAGGAQRVIENVLQEIDRQTRVRARSAAALASPAGADAARQAAAREVEIGQRRRQEFLAAAPADNADAIRAAIEAQIQELTNVRTLFEPGANQEQIATLQRFIAQLEDPIAEASDTVANELLSGATRIGRALDEGVQFLNDSGIGASRIREQFESVGRDIERIVTQAGETTDPAVRESLNAERIAREQLASDLRQAAENVNLFSEAINRTSNDLVDAVSQEARGFADQARQDENRLRAELQVGGPRDAEGRIRRQGELEAEVNRAAERRRAAEEAAAQAEVRRNEVQRANQTALQAFEERAERGMLGVDAQRLTEQRQRLRSELDDPAITVAARQQIEAQVASINQSLSALFEQSPLGASARNAADQAAAEAQSARERIRQLDEANAAAERGRVLAQTPGQRAADEFADQASDIREFFARQAREQNRPLDARAQQAALDAAFSEQARSIAPAIFSLSDLVANAVLAGPSRQALDVVDISTTEGAKELNRLLRGDDPARDQNLEELRKQSRALDELVRQGREPAPIAN